MNTAALSPATEPVHRRYRIRGPKDGPLRQRFDSAAKNNVFAAPTRFQSAMRRKKYRSREFGQWKRGEMGESLQQTDAAAQGVEFGHSADKADYPPGSRSPGQAPATAPWGSGLEASPCAVPLTTPRVQPETLPEVTDLLDQLRLLLRHITRCQKGWNAVAAGRSTPGDASGTGLPTEIYFDLLSRTPEEIAADSQQIERLYSSVSTLAAMAAPATVSSIAITGAFLRDDMGRRLPLEAQSAARRLRLWAFAVVSLAFGFFLLTVLVLVYVDRGRREIQQLEDARNEYQMALGAIYQSRDPDLLSNCLSAVPVETISNLRGGPGVSPLCDRLRRAWYGLRIARADLEAWNTVWNWLSFMPPGRLTHEPQERLQSTLPETQWGASELHASVNMAGLTGFVLPMLLGLLGAFTYVYRNIDRKIRTATLSSGDGAHATLRVLLGMMLGGLLGVIWTNG